MSQKIGRDVETMAKLLRKIKKDYPDEKDPWKRSRFAWIRARASRQKGTIGEKLVENWLTGKGFSVGPSPDSEADMIINGMRVEVKFSTLWRGGFYKFQQLRDQDYQFVVCLGFSPSKVHCWVIPKSVIMREWRKGVDVKAQHGGGKGRDTAWLSVVPGNEPKWLKECGGRLAGAAALIAKITGRKPLP